MGLPARKPVFGVLRTTQLHAHPRSLISAFFIRFDKSKYVTDLKKWLDFAYKTVSREALRQGRRHKSVYDLRVRESQLHPGDRVLARNVGVKGKRKIADRWEKDVYLVSQIKTYLFNLLNMSMAEASAEFFIEICCSPFMALPASKPNPLDTSLRAGSTQPLPVVTTDTVYSADEMDLADTSSNDEVSPARSEDAGTQSASQPTKYVIAPKRRGYQGSTLNPLATSFTPRSQEPQRTGPARTRRKPRWQINGDWRT